MFVDSLEMGVDAGKLRNKDPLQIHYIHYQTWALELRKKGVGPIINGKEPKYLFPPVLLALLRSLVPEGVKGEI